MIYKRLAYGFGIIALISSAGYMFVYLYRWEWNRAILAGIFLIAAAIPLAVAAILERISSLERSINNRADIAAEERALQRLEETAPAPHDHFAWLKDTESMNVFVPFLMGAGLLASALAWVLERIAGATATPVLEHRLAARLAPISFPSQGLLEGGPAALERSVTRAPRSFPLKPLLALTVAVLLGTVGIDVLGDATQTRPDRLIAGTTSEIVVDVEIRGNARLSRIAMDSLWGACAVTVPNDLTQRGIVRLGASSFQLNLHPAVGKYGERRLRGCLEDVTVDNIRADVVSFSR
ncbi:MAG: hypothetical protein M3238_08405 [Actinomycetota bacterium]|nr:hypothetical protein [Actinomycetota bacterium]